MLDPFTKRQTLTIAGGTKVHVAEAGDGAPIVLLHGNPDTHAVWGPVVAQLASTFRCIAPDLPGYGDSTPPRDDELNLDGHARWVNGVVDALGLDTFHLVVHDVGGPYGLAFTLQHAQRLRSVTIMNTTCFADYKWHFWARVWRVRGLGEFFMKVAYARFLKSLFVREMRRGSPRMTREYAEHAFDHYHLTTRDTVLRWYRAMNPSVWTGRDKLLLAELAKLPHQVIWGDRDPFVPASHADRFSGTVHHLPDSGHWTMIEDPARVASELRAFCAKA